MRTSLISFPDSLTRLHIGSEVTLVLVCQNENIVYSKSL